MQYLSFFLCLGRRQLMFRPPRSYDDAYPTFLFAATYGILLEWGSRPVRSSLALLSVWTPPTIIHAFFCVCLPKMGSSPRRPLFCLHLTDRYRNHCRGGGIDPKASFPPRYMARWHGMSVAKKWEGGKGRKAKHLQKALQIPPLKPPFIWACLSEKWENHNSAIFLRA